jgi:D-alanyl-D-alanine carboxypeptidase (penicillin-binding protein 5/6)
MDESTPEIIETEQPESGNKFPIIAQLSVLLFILSALYGAYFFNQDDGTETPPSSVSEVVAVNSDSNTAPETYTIQKITDAPIVAEAAYVFDVREQRVLFAKNADEALPLASITKLMTALLAHELVADDNEMTVTQAAILQEGRSGLLPGETIIRSNLSQLALIASSNDAAYTLAASVGQLLGQSDPEQQFVAGMNIRAEELGLKTLQFSNTTGLDLSLTEAGAYGSARDVSYLMEYIIETYPEILEPTRQAATRVYNEHGDYHSVVNTNDVLFDIPNLLGSKTGYTDLAGGNLTIAFDAGFNRPIIITVLGSTRDARFGDVLTLVDAVIYSSKTP